MWAAPLLLILALAVGCATHQESIGRDIRSLTSDAREIAALEQFVQEYPDMADRDTMQAFLGGRRQGHVRRQALMIQLRHQYPKASAQELHVLVEDQMNRDAQTMLPMPPPGINCTSMNLGFGMTSTNCY